jgi:hypothetical protein
MLILVFNEPWTSEAREIERNRRYLSVTSWSPSNTDGGNAYLAAFFHYTVPEIFSTLPAILESVRDDGLDGLLRSAEFAQEAEELESGFKGVEGHVASSFVDTR